MTRGAPSVRAPRRGHAPTGSNEAVGSRRAWRASKPMLMGLRLGWLVRMYGWRLRPDGLQELFAGLGIAVGVALMFGVLVASASITGSASQALRGIIGSARLQLAARSPDGFDERLVERVGQLPGVKVAAPLLRGNVLIAGPAGRRSIQLIGVTASQLSLEGAATRNLGAGAELLAGGIGLPAALARSIGASPRGHVTLLSGGEANRLLVRAVLGPEAVGAVANSPIAAALLPLAQRVLCKPGKVTQILIEPNPGADRLVASELRTLAAGRLDVQPADHELSVLKATAAPTNQSSKLFAAIGAIVGFLIAANAMLLTVPERRRWIADLRRKGYSARQVILIFAFQALVLGAGAALVGILLGYVLAHTLFATAPEYLTLSFPIGSQPLIPLAAVVLAVAFGLIAALASSLAPLSRDLAPGRAIDSLGQASGKVGQSIRKTTLVRSAALGVVIVLAATLLALIVPRLSVAGGALLPLAVLCLVPCLLVAVVEMLIPISERIRGSMPALGLIELKSTATRSVALAGVAAVAIYGSVAVEGSRHDLLNGLDAEAVQYVEPGDLWVTANEGNVLTVDGLGAGGTLAAVAHIPGVASVRSYQGSLLDVGSRRLWIRARPPEGRSLIEASQILQGDLAQASDRIRSGGWATISNGLASERHLAVGDPFTFPTPSGPMQLRVAAVTTNMGWPPGVLTMNIDDYQRWWQTTEPSGLAVVLKPGVSRTSVGRDLKRALAAHPGLLVQTFGERLAQIKRTDRQGVRTLGEISTMILIAAALAIAFSLGAAISARKVDLAARKMQGYDSRQLLRSLLAESTVVLGVGAIAGAGLGIYGHALASRWLRLSQGFPAPFSLDLPQVLLTLGIVCGTALSVIACFGISAVRVSPSESLSDN